MRTEYGFLGQQQLDDNLYYRVQTKRILQLSNPSNEKLYSYSELIRVIKEIKIVVVVSHINFKVLNNKISDAIIKASKKIFDGKLNNQFHVNMIVGNDISTLMTPKDRVLELGI